MFKVQTSVYCEVNTKSFLVRLIKLFLTFTFADEVKHFTDDNFPKFSLSSAPRTYFTQSDWRDKSKKLLWFCIYNWQKWIWRETEN